MGRNDSHLTLDEGRRIERWRQANVSASKIAHTLGRLFHEILGVVVKRDGPQYPSSGSWK